MLIGTTNTNESNDNFPGVQMAGKGLMSYTNEDGPTRLKEGNSKRLCYLEECKIVRKRKEKPTGFKHKVLSQISCGERIFCI